MLTQILVTPDFDKNENLEYSRFTILPLENDTRQIVDSKTNDIENNDKKGGSRFLNIRQLMKKAI